MTGWGDGFEDAEPLLAGGDEDDDPDYSYAEVVRAELAAAGLPP